MKRALSDRDDYIRFSAAEVLWRIAGETESTVPVLLELMKTDNKAETLLGEMGEKAAAAVPALVHALGDRSVGPEWLHIEALGKIGPAAAPAVPILVEKLLDPGLTEPAARALQGIGPPSVPHLVLCLGSERPFLRYQAARILGKIGRAAGEAVPALKAARNDEDEEVRRIAGEALKRIQKFDAATNF
ncbi:MAG: HEAT repeat domain-containing protein [Planctomycetes bacterium]|nr:HEAT repeat domain-containing protein [Planctomycetota bacterium]